jgi:UDP:flavonoid glycosyltransferase YjiC (YdhE family)
VLHRFRAAAPSARAPLPADWWPGNDDPLVYATFGSVTAGAHLSYYPALYRTLIDALAPLRMRLLVTVGEPRDLAELGALPPNVRAEHWIPQDDVLPHAAVIVCHGGLGSTLGAIAHGVPLVVVPLFSIDQVANGTAVARAGAGVTLDGDIGVRTVLELPSAGTLDGLAPTVGRLLADAAHGRAAGRIAAAMAELPPPDAAVDVLAALGRH